MIINTTDSHVSGNLINKIFGSWKCTIPRNRKTGELELNNPIWYRAKNGIYHMDTETISISGIMGYSREINPDGTVVLHRQDEGYVEPDSTKNSLTNEEINVIRELIK